MNEGKFWESELSPIEGIAFTAAVLLAIGAGLYVTVPWIHRELSLGFLCLDQAQWDALRKGFFGVYALLFTSLWITYFLSRSGPTVLQVPTLRRLLRTFSVQWDPDKADTPKDTAQISLDDTYQKKSTAGIAAMAMLVATAGLELAQVNALMAAPAWMDATPWHKGLALAAAICAVVALICFLVAVDALDSIFNVFNDNAVQKRLRHHFYVRSIYSRYFGFVFLLSGVVLLIAHHNEFVGALSMGLVFAIGYAHWFPRPDVAHDTPNPLADLSGWAWVQGWPWALFTRLAVGAGLPLLLLVNEHLVRCH